MPNVGIRRTGALTICAITIGWSLGVGGFEPTCISYRPTELRIEASGKVWAVTDRRGFVQQALTREAADAMLVVASSFSKRCRVPTKSGRFATYWDGSVAIKGPLPGGDCLPYTPAALKIESHELGYRLGSPPRLLYTFSTRQDGQAILDVARQHKEVCYIGRNAPADVPNREQYILTYWR